MGLRIARHRLAEQQHERIFSLRSSTKLRGPVGLRLLDDCFRLTQIQLGTVSHIELQFHEIVGRPCRRECLFSDFEQLVASEQGQVLICDLRYQQDLR